RNSGRRPLQKIRESMPDGPHRLGSVALPALGQMQDVPFADQRLECQRRLGTLAFGIGPDSRPLGFRVYPLRDLAQPRSRRVTRLLDREIAPHPKRFAYLAL